jgi:hypothetical protein
MVNRVAAALAALATAGASLALACSDDTLSLQPKLDTPAPASKADPFPGLETISVEVARTGATSALVAQTFNRGDALVLPGVPRAPDLVVHLTGRIGDGEWAYGRTCAFDLQEGVPDPAPHLWFSRTVRWAEVAEPPTAARAGGMAWAASGAAVFAGGRVSEGGAPATTIDLYDPAVNAFVTIGELGPRTGAVVAARATGQALVVGGRDPGGGLAGFVELVDPRAPAAQRVVRIDDARLGLEGPGAATLADGGVVIIGGVAPPPGGGAEAPTGQTWLIAADGASFAPPRRLAATLAMPRSRPTLTRLSDDLGAPVLVIGGLGPGSTPVATAELFRPLREDFAPAAEFAPNLVVPRYGHQAVRMPDGSVLVLGGLDAAGQPVRTIELFSLVGGFVAAQELPAGAGAAGVVDITVTPLPDGRVLLAGGRETAGGPALATTFIVRVDPLGGTVDVLPTDRLATPRAGHHAVALCDGTILVAGGAGPGTPAERYNPPSLGRR